MPNITDKFNVGIIELNM